MADRSARSSSGAEPSRAGPTMRCSGPEIRLHMRRCWRFEKQQRGSGAITCHPARYTPPVSPAQCASALLCGPGFQESSSDVPAGMPRGSDSLTVRSGSFSGRIGAASVPAKERESARRRRNRRRVKRASSGPDLPWSIWGAKSALPYFLIGSNTRGTGFTSQQPGSFRRQRNHGVNPGCVTSRQKTGNNPCHGEGCHHQDDDQGIPRLHVI